MTADDIKALRACFRCSQGEWAQLLGVTRSSVAYWEQGRAKPRDPTLANLLTLRTMLTQATGDMEPVISFLRRQLRVGRHPVVFQSLLTVMTETG